jgi:hypothetical protein
MIFGPKMQPNTNFLIVDAFQVAVGGQWKTKLLLYHGYAEDFVVMHHAAV